MENSAESSAVGSLGKRILAWIIIAAVVIIAVKLIIGAVFGIITFIFTVALIGLAIMGVLWALRHL
jgi:hypothetical protein